MMRWLRLVAGAAIVGWLLVMARREALRRGRRSLATALTLAGAGLLCFLLAVSPLHPAVSNLLLGLALVLLAGALAVVLWQGFRG